MNEAKYLSREKLIKYFIQTGVKNKIPVIAFDTLKLKN